MSGIENMNKRLDFLGTSKEDKWGSDGRIIDGKLRSFRSALNNSYQAEWIVLNGEEEDFNYKKYRCLINPDKLKEDYDKKIISADFQLGLKEGSVFYWERTQTHWLVTLHHIEEEAYFRADVQRCNYQFEINDHKYWVYMRGPVETTLQWRQKNNTEFNDLNYSLLMYITKNEETLSFLKRHQIVTFDDHRWKVVATDIYSAGGYIQVYLDEYFDNELEEKENRTPQKEDNKIEYATKPYIDGPSIVYTYDKKIVYSIKNIELGEFVVSSNLVEITKMNDSQCVLKILDKKGNFEISYKKEDEVVAALSVEIKSF